MTKTTIKATQKLHKNKQKTKTKWRKANKQTNEQKYPHSKQQKKSARNCSGIVKKKELFCNKNVQEWKKIIRLNLIDNRIPCIQSQESLVCLLVIIFCHLSRIVREIPEISVYAKHLTKQNNGCYLYCIIPILMNIFQEGKGNNDRPHHIWEL